MPGYVRPAADSHEYATIVGYAVDITGVQNGSEPPHVKQFLVRSIQMELRNILMPETHRRTRSHSTFYPGRDSIYGFLGWGESLSEVLAKDQRVLERLGRTASEIGTRLRQVLDTSPREMKIRVIGSNNGKQPCPFAGHRNDSMPHANRDYSISRGRNHIIVPGLAWHLIAEHGFFEGEFTPYRIDPAQLVKVLFG